MNKQKSQLDIWIIKRYRMAWISSVFMVQRSIDKQIPMMCNLKLLRECNTLYETLLEINQKET